ncbi:hypothetical protein BC831DRAFT_442648 [Entophlyctis helioformis]|nr:hypothetical protein BC831DRAFT_442648 [Entophlyctis helioformis]
MQKTADLVVWGLVLCFQTRHELAVTVATMPWLVAVAVDSAMAVVAVVAVVTVAAAACCSPWPRSG